MFHLRSLFYRWVCSPHFLPLLFVREAGEMCLGSLLLGEWCCSLIDVGSPLAKVITSLCLWFCSLVHLESFSWRLCSSSQVHNLFFGELAPDLRMLFEGDLLLSPPDVFLRLVDQVCPLGLLWSRTCVSTVGQDDWLLSPLDAFLRFVSQVCLLGLLWSCTFHLVLIPPGFSSLVTLFCSGAFLAQLGLGGALVGAWWGFPSHLESATWLLTPGTFIVVACL